VLVAVELAEVDPVAVAIDVDAMVVDDDDPDAVTEFRKAWILNLLMSANMLR
jgi:hypothetical protein